MAENPLTPYKELYKELRDEQQSWRPHWGEISKYLEPYSGRYLENEEDNSDGRKLHKRIINGVPAMAKDDAVAGIHSGLTHPSTPWFKLGSLDEELMEYEPARKWFHETRNMMMMIYHRSNFYDSVVNIYDELITFNTAAMLMDESISGDRVMNCRPFTIGEFMIACDCEYRPDILVRQMAMTARQMEQKFGLDACSRKVRDAIKNNKANRRNEVIHIIKPAKVIRRRWKYESVYFEKDAENKFLLQSGYRVKPFAAPRWNVKGTDDYGRGPGMRILGDVKELQTEELLYLKSLSKEVDPPMNAPSSMKTEVVNLLAGGIQFNDDQYGVRPVHEVKTNHDGILRRIDQIERRIERGLYVDLFRSLMDDTKRKTAYETAKQYEQSLTMLGPMVQRFHNEFLNPVIDRTLDIMENRGILPPAPPEIQGHPIKVEYISTIAQAQKMVGLDAIEHIVGFAAEIYPIKPDIMDKVDLDEALDQVADMVGVAPDIVVSDDKVALIRAERAKQQQQMAMIEAGGQMAQAAKTLSETDVGSGNALNALIGA